MEIGNTRIPDEMYETANNEFFAAVSMNGLPNCTDGERLGFALVGALRWLEDSVLHPRNVDFHRAILAAERERFPGSDQDLMIIARRVDFEYGVSFARNYIRKLFVAEKPEPVPDLRRLVHRQFHKLWAAAVGQEAYNKEAWNKLDNLLNLALWPQGGGK